MKLPISWLKDYVDISGLEVIDLARILTSAGLEIDDIRFAGLPLPSRDDHGFKVSGIAWDREKLVVAEIYEVNPHPNADRLTLCDLFDGKDRHIVLTGAPNLYPYKGIGKLEKPIKVAYAKEGSTIYDGHADGLVLTTLKRAKIRGVDSYSMVCSEKELGISEEHEGVIFLDDDAVAGTPLVDYMGDAVLEVSILPNHARNTNILGLAREVAALTGRELKKPNLDAGLMSALGGQPVTDLVKIEIANPELNPRFTLALIRDVKIQPSPYWVQRRLRLIGMRPISNIVDATNYTMFEIGEPLHAFDYDVLVGRDSISPRITVDATNYAMFEIGEPLHAFDYDVLVGRDSISPHITISTRTATPGEKLTTLDGVERTLTETNVLVCDSAGPLSIAGIMGGAESEVTDKTTNILLEAAAWNFINIRRTANQHSLPSEASYRFSRGVHPALAIDGLKRCLSWMAQWSGGTIAPGIVDNYPLPPKEPTIEIRESDIRRALGIEIPLEQVKGMLERLEFKCDIQPVDNSILDDSNTQISNIEYLAVNPPPIRLDIGTGIVGVADVMEEIARVYGYDNIPETRMADPLPPQRGNISLEREERVRDILASLGLQEIITHRMTAPEIENRLLPSNNESSNIRNSIIEYVKLANYITPEKRVMRRSVLASVLNVVEKNARIAETMQVFEVGSVYIPVGGDLPLEPRRLSIAMTGKRYESAWDSKLGVKFDFYDLKGLVEGLMDALHLSVTYAPAEHPSFHPGKCAAVLLGDKPLGVFGELHPLVAENYDFVSPVLAADFDLEAILPLMPAIGHPVRPVSEFPPVLEDIAIIVDENLPADRAEALIRQTGGKMLESVRLFDVFRSEQIGAGKKSLAYALVYRSYDGTLTDKDAAGIRTRIIKRLEMEIGAKLRS